MKQNLLSLCTIVFALLLGSCSSLTPSEPMNKIVPVTGFTLKADIEYGFDESQKLDIYFPLEAAAESRTIVFIYGASWRNGSRKEFEFIGQTLADAGHTVIIPDYRHYPAVVYPEFINDLVRSLNELDQRALELLGSDLDQIVLMGHSAGAHLAALLSSDADLLADIELQVIGLIAIAGQYDLSLSDAEVQAVFRNVERSSDVRPVDQVTQSHPPTLLIHGSKDKLIPIGHTERYAEVLKAAQVNVETLYLEKTGHIGSISGLAAPLDAKNRYQEKALSFLDSL